MKTMNTVPPHVGDSVEVPYYMNAKYIYFRNRGENAAVTEIVYAFRKQGASVEIIDTDGPSSVVKL